MLLLSLYSRSRSSSPDEPTELDGEHNHTTVQLAGELTGAMVELAGRVQPHEGSALQLVAFVLDSLVVVVVKFWVIGETTQVISRVQGMKSRTTFYFSDLFDEEVFFIEKTSSSKSSGQCIDLFDEEVFFIEKTSSSKSSGQCIGSLPGENFYRSLLKVFPKSSQCRKMSAWVTFAIEK
ncbi:hypothetical protein F2Q68_00026579 [Brassica cretica]|uniref:Uncharacterized protein n=1 Tax=Brassica cretica TaxID=69181 RepID=A0A8S9ID29_BRACR|nr:hypothetical protein F2Q68_00026579 [Brassica cretica]